jgi:hypothetical protein
MSVTVSGVSTSVSVDETTVSVDVTTTPAPSVTFASVGLQGATGPTGATGATGPSGVIAVTSPITNSGTLTSATLGINQSLITVAQSQVTNLTTDLAGKAPTASPTFTGNVGVGVSPAVNFHVGADGAAQARVQRNSTDTSGPIIAMVKQRGSAASPTVVASGDQLGMVAWFGYDGGARVETARIMASVDAAPGSGDMPSRLEFYTSADGTTTLVERMRISNAGLITGSGTSLGAWTAYTPTWGGNTTNPVIGNGTLTGFYCQMGKMVSVRVRIVAGSTTTFGSGSYFVSMPVTAKTTEQPISSGYIRDASAGINYLVIATPATTANLWLRYSDTPTDVNETTPFTWAVNDQINLAFMYEAA